MKAMAFKETKKQYRKLLELGMILSLLFCVIILQGSKRILPSERKLSGPLPDLVQTDAIRTEQKREKQAVERPRIPVRGADEEMMDDEAIPAWLEREIPEFTRLPDPPDPPDIPRFIAVEKNAFPIGGFKAILEQLEYPELARMAGIEGRVTVYVKINEKGEVVKTQIFQSFGFEPCDINAIKAVRAVKWQPALQRDQPVAVWVSVPIDYRLR